MIAKRLLLTACLVTLFALFIPLPASAQAVYGSIFGTITDQQGAAVPSATITVTETRKGITLNTTTNETGNYTVTHLVPGTYTIRAEGGGFKAFEATDIQVFADQAARVDGQLQVGAKGETITVTAEDIPLLKTDRSDVATTFTGKGLTDLPVITRNFTEFQLLTPGTQTLTWQHAAAENTQRSTQIFVNGQHFSGSSYQLDGTDNRDPILGIIVVNPILDTVSEAKISTQNYDAEFGQALAAVVTAQTKSGTNTLHGSAYMYRRNDQLQARDPFTEPPVRIDPVTRENKPKPDALWSQFGGTVGFPLVKNKLFFFGGYQGTREKVGRTVLVTVPTASVFDTCLNPASPICDLSAYLAGGLNQVYNPADRTPFAGNIIPKSLLSTGAIRLLSLLPRPTLPGLDPSPLNEGTRQNFASGGTGGFDDDSFTTRADYAATEKLHLFGRYSFFKSTLGGKGVFDTADVAVGGRGLGLNGFAGTSNTRNQSLGTGFDYVLSNTLLTDFRFGWFKYRVAVTPNGLGTSPATDFGLPGLNLDEFFSSGMPAFFIGDSGQIGGDMEFGYALADRLTRCNCPLNETEDQFQFVNNWTNIRGNHQFKFGADIRYARNLRIPSDRHRAGELSFAKGRTASAGGTGGLPLATFLLGDVTRFTRYPPTAPPDSARERQKRWFFYGQDKWRATPKLTLTMGLRWEIYFPEKVTGAGGGGLLDLDTGFVRVAGVGDIGNDFGVENSFTNFAPRLGIAYELNNKTVVRMGYGRSFDIGVFGSTFGHVVSQNLPVLAIQEDVAPSSLASVFNLATGPSAPPTIDVPANGLIPLPDGTFQRARPFRMRMPTVDAWNLTIQRQITPTLSLEVGYVGNKGTHVFSGDGSAFNVNPASIVGFTPGRNNNPAKPFFNRYPFQSVNAAGQCTAFANAGPNGVVDTPPGGAIAGDDKGFCWTQGIDGLLNVASNNYHGLQTKVEKRFSNGYQIMAHYTWSQAFNYSDEYYAIDPKVNYGPNSFNRRHVFVFTNLVELPFGRGKRFGSNSGRALDYIIGGWQINTITNWSGGLPFTPTLTNCDAVRDTGPCRPDRLVDPGEVETGDRDQWFPVGLGAVWARPTPGVFGNSGRNSLRGPSFFQTDLSIFKNFVVTERMNAQFRAEFTNVFNHVNLGTPGVFFSQFGGGGGNCVDCGSGDGKITSLGGPMRQAQFALKFTF